MAKKRRNKLRVVGQPRANDTAYFDELNNIVDRIYDCAAGLKWTWHKLSVQAGISHVAVKRLGERITRYPQLRTVLHLAEAVGMEFSLVTTGVMNHGAKFGTTGAKKKKKAS